MSKNLNIFIIPYAFRFFSPNVAITVNFPTFSFTIYFYLFGATCIATFPNFANTLVCFAFMRFELFSRCLSFFGRFKKKARYTIRVVVCTAVLTLKRQMTDLNVKTG